MRNGEKKFSPKFRSYLTRARKFRKKNSKKIQKIRKLNFGIISIQNGLRESKNETKEILVPNSIPTLAGQEYSEKKIAKIFKKLKNLFPALFLAKTGLDRPRKRKKKNLVPHFTYTRPG